MAARGPLISWSEKGRGTVGGPFVLMEQLVYKLTWPNGKSYIGKTNNLRRRMGALRRSKLLAAVWRSHGEPEVAVLHRCELRAEVFVLEAYEIHRHGTTAPKGYNVSPGAEGRTVEQVRAWTSHPDFKRLSSAALEAWRWLTR